MDLSFSRPIAVGDADLPAHDMALLIAALAARSEESVTARAQAALDRPVPTLAFAALLAPPTGAFNDAMAARLAAWHHA